MRSTRYTTGRTTKTRTLLLGGALLLIAAYAGPADQASGAAPVPSEATWKAVAATGNVEALASMLHERNWYRVERGDLLQPLTQVRTGSRSRTTLVQNASILIVDPDSQVSLPRQAGDGSTVIQDSGSVIYEVDSRTQQDFRVVTPYLVAGVKGTVFMVTVSDGFASVTVEQGEVEVSTGDEFSLTVGAGESVYLDAQHETALQKIDVDVSRPQQVERRFFKQARADTRRLADARREELRRWSDRHPVSAERDGLGEPDRKSLGGELERIDGGSAEDLKEDQIDEEERKPEPTPLPPDPDPDPDPAPRNPEDKVQQVDPDPTQASTAEESLLDELLEDLEGELRDEETADAGERRRGGKADRVDPN